MGIKGLHIYQTNEKSEILDAIKNQGGILLYVAKSLGCSPQTLYELRAFDPDIEEAFKEARRQHIEAKSDLAENVIHKLMKKIDDVPDDKDFGKLALSAAQYHLNNMGKSRGYAHPQDNNPLEKKLEEIDANIKKASKEDKEE